MGVASKLRTKFSLKSLAAIAFCGGLASLLSVFLRGDLMGYALPLMFLLVVISIAQVCGVLPAIVTAVIVGVAFAWVLFPPFDSLAVQDTVDQLILVAFELAAVGVACLSSPTS